MARCPGQDQRFWKPDDIFEIECPDCGISVEFWKDEPRVKCPNCKQDIVNPKLDLGCAKWCQYAEECLGMINKQENTVLSNKLIECLRQIPDINRKIIRDSLEVLRYAERILVKEGGDPLVIKASAIFSEVYQIFTREGSNNPDKGTIDGQEVNIRNILATHDVNSDIISHICRILDACQSGTCVESLEFNIVWDSHQLAHMLQPEAITRQTPADIPWKTKTGQQLAKEISESKE